MQELSNTDLSVLAARHGKGCYGHWGPEIQLKFGPLANVPGNRRAQGPVWT